MKFGLIASTLIGAAFAVTPDCKMVKKDLWDNLADPTYANMKLFYDKTAAQPYTFKVWSDFFYLKPSSTVATGCDAYKSKANNNDAEQGAITLQFLKPDCKTALTTAEALNFVSMPAVNTLAGTTLNLPPNRGASSAVRTKKVKINYFKIKTNAVAGVDLKVCVKAAITGVTDSEAKFKINFHQRSDADTAVFHGNWDMAEGDFFDLKESSTGLECGITGYKDMVKKAVDLILFAIPIAKEIFKAILPDDLKLAVDHLYDGFTGSALWLGYVMATAYFLGEDQGFGEELCEGSGYAYAVIDTLHVMVDWDEEEEPAA